MVISRRGLPAQIAEVFPEVLRHEEVAKTYFVGNAQYGQGGLFIAILYDYVVDVLRALISQLAEQSDRDDGAVTLEVGGGGDAPPT